MPEGLNLLLGMRIKFLPSNKLVNYYQYIKTEGDKPAKRGLG
jgi:hypothetical protein